MDLEFSNQDLKRLDEESSYNGGYAQGIVRAFRRVIRFIRSASDERDFRAMRSLKYEKLKGERSHEHSLRLNDQWRLVIQIRKGNPKNSVIVKGIEDYH